VPVLVYLASPYSHAAIRDARYQAACRATAALISAGHVVFSPIVHSHPLVAFGLAGNWETWERIDRAFLERFDEVAVLMLDGWDQSIGVQAELRIAREMGKPVRFLEVDATGSPTSAPVTSSAAG
jgi:hypothetical protein